MNNLCYPASSGPSGVSPAYYGTPVDAIIKYTKSLATGAGGDPDKAAHAILDVVAGTGLARGKERYLRLPLGSECKKALEEKIQVLRDTLKNQEEIICSTDIA